MEIEIKTKIQTKRIYESPDPSDGRRVLIDRLWPRAIPKQRAQIDFWARSVAPSNELRKWYQHDPEKWPEFKKRYVAELDQNAAAVAELKEHLKGDVVTFVFSSKEEKLNNATVLLDYLKKG